VGLLPGRPLQFAIDRQAAERTIELYLRQASQALAVQVDARRSHELLAQPELRQFLDFTRPIGLRAIAILHFVPDNAEARAILKSLIAGIPSGSHVVLTHATADAVSQGG